MRATAFGLVGVAFFLHWTFADPSYEATDSQSEWVYVLSFSGVILLIALAILAVGRLVRTRLVRAAAIAAAAGAIVSSAANVFEDGLGLSWVFFVTVVGIGTMAAALPTLAVLFATLGRGRERLLALAPSGTLAGVLFYVAAGGPIMLATWSFAAVLAAKWGTRRPSDGGAEPEGYRSLRSMSSTL